MTYTAALLTSQLAGMVDFVTRFTGASGTILVNAQSLIRNNLHSEIGRAGYYPVSASTSEAQIMLARGYLWAFKATGEASYLTKAKAAADAFIAVFHKGVEPPVSAVPWYGHWIANAGPELVPEQGPAADPYTGYGTIGASIAFTAGVGSLPAGLSIVYRVYTGDLSWNNVFASLADGGVDYLVDHYINSDGKTCTERKNDGSWGNIIGSITGEPAGKIVLTTSYTGTLKVSYSVLTGTTVPINTGFEAWPMWRPLVSGGAECVMATDAIHWEIDLWRLLVEAEPGEVRWSRALAATVATWDEARVYLGASSAAIYAKEDEPAYNSWPLVYWYGVRGVTGFSSPDATVTESRNVGLYAQFNLDVDVARTGFYFENASLYLTPGASSSLGLELGSNTAMSFEVRVFLAGDATAYSVSNALAGTGVETFSFPLSSFKQWPGSAFRPYGPAGSYIWSDTTKVTVTNSDGATPFTAERITIPNDFSGWGYSPSPAMAMPLTLYGQMRSGTPIVRATDAGGWFWYKSLTVGAPGSITLNWTDGTWSTSGYQEAVGTPPGSPTGSVSQIVLVAGASAVIDVGWISATVPPALSAAPLSKVTVAFWTPTSAVVLQVGDIAFTAATRTAFPYMPGVIPFNFARFGGGARSAGGAQFQGPVYTVYQSLAPYQSAVRGGTRDVAAATNVFACMSAAQDAYQTSTGVSGPFAPVFLPPTWEGAIYGTVGQFTWAGPDPNTGWGGFQARTFAESGYGWYLFKSSVPAAATVTNRWLSWLDTWLRAHPDATMLPSHFLEGEAPSVVYQDPHALALTIKGVLYARLAGSDQARCARILQRLLRMLEPIYDTTELMHGAFSPTPGVAVYYGFWHGEILHVLGLLRHVWNTPAIVTRRRRAGVASS